MRKKIIATILLVALPIYPGGQSMLKFSEEAAKKAAIAAAVQQTTQAATMVQTIRNTLHVASVIRNPVGHAVFTFTKGGLKLTDPLLQKYLGFQLAGEAGKLTQLAEGLKTRIKKRWPLPMRHEKMQLKTLQAILETQATKELATIREGTLEQALEAHKRLKGEWQLYEMRKESGEIQPVIMEEHLVAAKQLIEARTDYQQMLQRIECERQQKLAEQELIQKQELVLKDLTIDAQSRIINDLQQSKDHKDVTVHVGQTVDHIFTTAYKYNYNIHPEIDFQITTSLDALTTVSNHQEFTYHIATIDHLLNDIQEQMAQVANVKPTILDRSPELLSRAVTKYFEYIAPTENEIAFICDLAGYVSDISIGTEYLTQEVVTQRIQQFWDMVDRISFETLSNLSANNVIDSVMYVAARASWVWGATKAIPLLKNLKMVGSSATTKVSTIFADKFIKVFDNVIGNSPTIINADGTIIWNASKKITSKPYWIIQVFDGLKNKITGKTPPEIVDDTQKVIENEKIIKSAKTPVGGRGKPLKIVSKNKPTVINGTKFTGHALDQMQSRGALSPSVVLDVVKNPAKVLTGNTPGTKIFIRDNLKVVINDIGDIVTVILQ